MTSDEILRPCERLGEYLRNLESLFDLNCFPDPEYLEIKEYPDERISYKQKYFETMRGFYCKYNCGQDCSYNNMLEGIKK